MPHGAPQSAEQLTELGGGGEGEQRLPRAREQQPGERPVPVEHLGNHRQAEVRLRAGAFDIVVRGGGDAIAGRVEFPGLALPGQGRRGPGDRREREGRTWRRGHELAQATQCEGGHLGRMPISLEGDGAQRGAARQQGLQQGEELLAHGLGVVVHVEAPAPPAGDDAPREVDLNHLLQGKAVEPRVRRETRGELVAEQVAQVDEQRQAGARVELAHEVEHVQLTPAGEGGGVLQGERHVAESGLGEGRREVEVAREGLSTRVPPAHVIAHPGAAHGAGMGVEVRERLGGLEVRPVEVEVDGVEEDGHVGAAGPHLGVERGVGARLIERERSAVLDEVEEAGLLGEEPVRVRLVGGIQVAAEAQASPG